MEKYQSCQRRSYFCEQKLMAPPSLEMYRNVPLTTSSPDFSGTEREREKEKEHGETIKGPLLTGA